MRGGNERGDVEMTWRSPAKAHSTMEILSLYFCYILSKDLFWEFYFEMEGIRTGTGRFQEAEIEVVGSDVVDEDV